MSSAKSINSLLITHARKELMNNVKRNGPTTEPWTTPYLTDASCDNAFFTHTYCALEHKKRLAVVSISEGDA